MIVAVWNYCLVLIFGNFSLIIFATSQIFDYVVSCVPINIFSTESAIEYFSGLFCATQLYNVCVKPVIMCYCCITIPLILFAYLFTNPYFVLHCSFISVSLSLGTVLGYFIRKFPMVTTLSVYKFTLLHRSRIYIPFLCIYISWGVLHLL